MSRFPIHTRYRLIGLWAALATSATACAPDRYRSYYIPSESMQPALQVNDRIMVDRSIYQSSEPQRGDIVIFRPTAKMSQLLQGVMEMDQQTVFVKRIVGLPGETIEVKQGQVYIDRQSLPEPYITIPPNYQWGPVTVPADSFMVLGDNRNDAFDSHYWGAVPERLIVGKVFWRFWPIDRFGAVDLEETPP